MDHAGREQKSPPYHNETDQANQATKVLVRDFVSQSPTGCHKGEDMSICLTSLHSDSLHI